MDKRTTDIVAYLTWAGLIIAFLMGDRENSKFHINQSLVIWLVGTVAGMLDWIPLVGGLVGAVLGLFCAICWLLGLIGAIQGEEKPVPFLGQFQLLK
ncbi:MAG: hypothetical protein IJ955_01780 [Oscillospiraceae bacterium]|nr:hypothetical protein [Oscillospiraceae bacterium]